jgi:hypothetical protein
MNRNRKRRSGAAIAFNDFIADALCAIKYALMIVGAGVIAFAIASLLFQIL